MRDRLRQHKRLRILGGGEQEDLIVVSLFPTVMLVGEILSDQLPKR